MQILLASAKIMKERLEDRVTDPSLLKEFSYEGFSFAREKDGAMLFVR